MKLWLAKKVLGGITTKVMKARELKLLRKGNKKRDENQLQISQLQKTTNKLGKYVEEIHKDVAILKSDSHPPLFTRNDLISIQKEIKSLSDRLNKIEKGS